MRNRAGLVATILALVAAAPALAAGPENWQFGFGPSATEMKERIVALHDHLLMIGIGIALLVAGLLIFVLLRFRASRHPVANKLRRLPWLEFGWTVIPVAVLGAIAVPSLQLLAYESRQPDAGLTVKVSGHQWFWRYTYPEHGGFSFDSLMMPPAQLPAGEPRLLAVDNRLVVPAGVNVRIQVTSSDVVHSFFMPALGMQIYAVPGRLNETWTRIERPGVYYGQCNQICGLDHAFMPIAIEAMSQTDFDAWVGEANERFSAAVAGETDMAWRIGRAVQ